MGEPAEPTRLIGIALGLPEPYSTELQAWRERLGDPSAHQIAPHITLQAPITVATPDLAAVDEHLRRVAARHSPWTLRLDGGGTFRPVTPVVFTSVAQGAAECAALAADVASGVLARPASFPYHPHVTVAHGLSDLRLDAAEAAMATYTAVWKVWGFTLFERGADEHWRPQRDYPFGTAVGPAPPG